MKKALTTKEKKNLKNKIREGKKKGTNPDLILCWEGQLKRGYVESLDSGVYFQ